ncbi:MAG: hypothetical protein GY714_21910 [Desulfobacterales bacterium]|nr:hypothetical protein [Desulfobacterales bacterium]
MTKYDGGGGRGVSGYDVIFWVCFERGGRRRIKEKRREEKKRRGEREGKEGSRIYLNRRRQFYPPLFVPAGGGKKNLTLFLCLPKVLPLYFEMWPKYDGGGRGVYAGYDAKYDEGGGVKTLDLDMT